jgi:hypothetical protein
VRAIEHSSVNQGASYFSMRFGFLYLLILLRLITPAFRASSIKKFSIRAALLSLSVACNFIISAKAVVNSTVDECSFHF